MSKDEQNRLAAACAEVAELTGQALTWVSAPSNADLVGVEARSLTRQMRRSIRRARRLGHAAQTRMSVSVFGPSQAGKSFLVSVLARPEGGRLVGAFDGPGGALDYIAEVNPEGEGESTGLVTRFTMARDPAPEGFPVRLTLLSEADLIRVLINSFFNDGDNSEIPPEPEVLSAHLDAFRARMGGVQPGLSEDEVWEVGEYIAGSFGKIQFAICDFGSDIFDFLSCIINRFLRNFWE